jgi:ABC-type glycerol-3-phosphate transport system substrate-binding protein
VCSCAQVVEEIIPEFSVDNASADLGGFECVWGYDGAAGETELGFVTGTRNADLLLERKAEIEKSLNCKITPNYTSSMFDFLRAGVMSGAQPFDIVEGGTYTMVVDVRAGNLSGLSALLDIENVEKWGTPNMLQSLIWQKDVFGVVPFAWPDIMYRQSGHVLAVNESLVSRLGQPDPREYVEDGVWNWDKFEEVLDAYTFQDAGRTIYALRSHPPYFSINMFLSSGVALSAFDAGEVVCGVYTDIGREALERANTIFNVTHKDCFHPETGSVGHEQFINGEAVMYLSWCYELTSGTNWIMYQMDNIGILPFPQGPHATPGVYLSYHEGLGNATAIPFNAKDPNATAIILSAMYEPFEEYQTKDDIIDYMTNQIFYDRRDAEIIVNVVRNTEYGFFREGARTVIEEAVNTDKGISALLDSYVSRYDQIVTDYMIPHYQGRIAVYGE